MEVRKRVGPRPERDEDHERSKIEERTTEQWIDEGSVHEETAAPKRQPAGRRSKDPDVEPEVIAQIIELVGRQRGPKLVERLSRAAGALERERFGDARRMITPLVKMLPRVAAVLEIDGLSAYGLGQWTDASESLAAAQLIQPEPALLPVLADAYRGQRRWTAVDKVWEQLKAESPSQEIMTEGRIVAASSLADRGELKPAIALLEAASGRPKRVRDHHLRQWYVLADLYDRAGDTLAATRWFRAIADRDPDFVDVRDRLRSLGR